MKNNQTSRENLAGGVVTKLGYVALFPREGRNDWCLRK